MRAGAMSLEAPRSREAKRSAHGLFEDLGAPGGAEGVALLLGALRRGGDASVFAEARGRIRDAGAATAVAHLRRQMHESRLSVAPGVARTPVLITAGPRPCFTAKPRSDARRCAPTARDRHRPFGRPRSRRAARPCEFAELERARAYERASLAPATLRAYAQSWRDFEAWCAFRGVGALPARPEDVGRYLAELADRGRKVATIRRHVAAIARAHDAADVADPTASSRDGRSCWASRARTARRRRRRTRSRSTVCAPFLLAIRRRIAPVAARSGPPAPRLRRRVSAERARRARCRGRAVGEHGASW